MIAIGSAAVAVLLSACAVVSPSTVTETITATVTATASPPAPSAETVTCENVLTADAYAELTTSGLILLETPPLDALPEVFHDRATVYCAWGTPHGSDAGWFYAQTQVTPEEWQDAKASLQNDGLSPQSDPRGELLTGEPSDLGYVVAALYADGALHYTSDLPVFDMVAALQ